MKTLSAILAITILATFIAADGAARESAKPGLRMTKAESETQDPGLVDPGLRGLYEEAAVDTYCLVWYDFEIRNWQGWTRVDETAQRGDFWHVDDFAGLAGYAALEGAKSMWCGARPNPADPYFCSWAAAPGYGSNWDQSLSTAATPFVGAVTLSYRIAYDVEPDYDYVRVEYSEAGGWETAAEYTGQNDTIVSLFLPLTAAQTKLRFRFTSDGAWSDQDGLYDTHGACVIDSISLSDAGAFSDFEDFEAAPIGAIASGVWSCQRGDSFGTYSGLTSNLLTDKDPCGENFSSLIVFYIGSPVPSTSYPGLYDTPFCVDGRRGSGATCQDERIVSPPIDTRRYSTGRDGVQDGVIPPGELSSLGGYIYRFTVYDDLPLANLVFYQWHVRNVENGCPGPWEGSNFIYYCCGNQGWMFGAEVVSALIESDTVQVSFEVFDMCNVWYLVNGNCAQHTPAPWFDNVRLYRYNNSGPQWSYRDLDLFQDNFPALEFDIESYVRADAANDINTNDDPVIRPGDSIVVDCGSYLGGSIAADPTYGGPAVYLHVKCAYIGPAPAKPGLFGPSLAGSVLTGLIGSPYTINFNYASDDGVWTKIQCDTARTSRWGIQRDRYMVDLNDELFTRGYLIEYYFTARDSAGVERSLPKWARSRGPHFEWTCLPTKNSKVLFVDDFTGRGSFAGSVENYWMPVFDYAPGQPNANVDKYDVSGPTSSVSNGPGSRAKNHQLTQHYDAIIWDCGDLESTTISDGTVNSDKSNDCRMLIDWMNLSEHDVGLWICGDDVAYDLDGLASIPALTLLHTWCGVDFIETSYYEVTGGRTGGGIFYPLVTGEVESGVFVHGGAPDSLYLQGGCFVMNQFDVLEKTANGKYALSYPVHNATNRYAAISSSQLNAGGHSVRTMFFGFSFQYVRDDVFAETPDRFELARNVFDWWQYDMNPGCCYTDAEIPAAYKLSQNFPNPFNPTTTIRFDMKAKGLVTVKIYDVAGRLVRTLVNETKDAGAYAAVWDGRNHGGAGVATGIYFYKMETAGFVATKKLVLLK